MGTLTINTTSAQDSRIVEAFGDFMGLVDGNGDPRNATGAEVKQKIIERLKEIVFSYENKVATEAASASVTTINPS